MTYTQVLSRISLVSIWKGNQGTDVEAGTGKRLLNVSCLEMPVELP